MMSADVWSSLHLRYTLEGSVQYSKPCGNVGDIADVFETP